jgi:Uma2 family endonuclease
MAVAPRSGRGASAEDLQALPEGRAAEILDGEIVDKAMPSFEHGSAQSGLSGALFPFRGPSGPSGRPGGWWLATEVEVEYEPHETFRHDMVGWRRDRVPHRPVERPVRLRPDFVCEVLSPSNSSTDTVKKLRVLQRHGVPHDWLLDPDARTLRVLRWTSEGYLEVLSATAEEAVRAEPFGAIEISLAAVFGLD